MIEGTHKSRAPLPYGMMLPLMFKVYGVDLEEEPYKTLLWIDIFDKYFLHRMGHFNKLMEDGWREEEM